MIKPESIYSFLMCFVTFLIFLLPWKWKLIVALMLFVAYIYTGLNNLSPPTS